MCVSAYIFGIFLNGAFRTWVTNICAHVMFARISKCWIIKATQWPYMDLLDSILEMTKWHTDGKTRMQTHEHIDEWPRWFFHTRRSSDADQLWKTIVHKIAANGFHKNWFFRMLRWVSLSRLGTRTDRFYRVCSVYHVKFVGNVRTNGATISKAKKPNSPFETKWIEMRATKW